MAQAFNPQIHVEPVRVSNFHLVKPGQTVDDVRALHGDGFLYHPHNQRHLTGPLMPGTRLHV